MLLGPDPPGLARLANVTSRSPPQSSSVRFPAAAECRAVLPSPSPNFSYGRNRCPLCTTFHQHRVPCGIARSRCARSLLDRKSTRLNSSHLVISYAVFCLKKKTQTEYSYYLITTQS